MNIIILNDALKIKIMQFVNAVELIGIYSQSNFLRFLYTEIDNKKPKIEILGFFQQIW
jgi:hypothetical protein